MANFLDRQRDALAQHLRNHLRGEVRFDATSRRLYSTDASIYQVEPLGVVIPRTLQDLVTTVQIAAETGVPLTARGGGTSLSGQSVGPGIIVDCSKYLNAVLNLDPSARIVRVQPGVVLDSLNRTLAAHGLQFGPEVATASRANLGGMIGNNSAGARSLIYGKTSDHVRRLGVILADGSRAEFGPLSAAEWDQRATARTLEGAVYRGVKQAVLEAAADIRGRFPRILRRVSGYNLDILCDQFTSREARPWSLAPLVVGSEGTLAVVTDAELGLVPRPPCRGLLVPHFATLGAALDATAACLEEAPSAVELMDGMLLELARGNLSLRDTMAAVQGSPAALLMVEFQGDDQGEVARRVEQLGRRLRDVPGVTAVVPALDPALRDPLWNLRSAAAAMLYGLPGDRKPIPFIEDAAVAPARLPEFTARFRDVLRRHGTDGAYYGHASVGCLHIRPCLNLKDRGDVARMRQITEEVTDLVLEFGGSLSGEHGDGLARSEWNRKMFGKAVYEAFRRVKHAFDPHNQLNPGKVVDAPAMTENLRYGPGYAPAEPPTVFDYSKQEGFVRAVELCNGAGVCRKMQGGAMCPSFRATRDEKDSTRGRANALRLALAGIGDQGSGIRKPESPIPDSQSLIPDPQSPIPALRQRWVYDVLDLCLMCKACKAECPSNVDMAKLKAEFLNAYYEGRPRPLGHLLMGRIYRLNRLGALAAPVANWLQERGLVRWLLEKTAGIDRRRSLPRLHGEHFRRWFAHHRGERGRVSAPRSAGPTRVLLLDDCFTTFNEPEIGRAAVTVLEQAGYAVELAGLTCCARPLISKGMLHAAREIIQAELPRLARRVADGTPILGLEPSCLLTLADEWPELVPGPDARRVAAAAHLADGWLAAQLESGAAQLDIRLREGTVLLHGHCHQKALVGAGGSAAALRRVPGLDVRVLDAGCCGMAGSFGFEKEHYDLSVAIAKLQLLPALAREPAAAVAATGTSCRHQIKDLDGRRALHPLEVLAEAAVIDH